jgi:hypothetical protein
MASFPPNYDWSLRTDVDAARRLHATVLSQLQTAQSDRDELADATQTLSAELQQIEKTDKVAATFGVLEKQQKLATQLKRLRARNDALDDDVAALQRLADAQSEQRRREPTADDVLRKRWREAKARAAREHKALSRERDAHLSSRDAVKAAYRTFCAESGTAFDTAALLTALDGGSGGGGGSSGGDAVAGAAARWRGRSEEIARLQRRLGELQTQVRSRKQRRRQTTDNNASKTASSSVAAGSDGDGAGKDAAATSPSRHHAKAAVATAAAERERQTALQTQLDSRQREQNEST